MNLKKDSLITHVALLKPTYSFPANLFMKFIICDQTTEQIYRQILKGYATIFPFCLSVLIQNRRYSSLNPACCNVYYLKYSQGDSNTHIIKFFCIAGSLLKHKKHNDSVTFTAHLHPSLSNLPLPLRYPQHHMRTTTYHPYRYDINL